MTVVSGNFGFDDKIGRGCSKREVLSRLLARLSGIFLTSDHRSGEWLEKKRLGLRFRCEERLLVRENEVIGMVVKLGECLRV